MLIIARLCKTSSHIYNSIDRWSNPISHLLYDAFSINSLVDWAIIESSKPLIGNAIMLENIENCIYWKSALYIHANSYFSMSLKHFIVMLHSWQQVSEEMSSAIDIVYDNKQILFKTSTKSGGFVATIIRDNDSYTMQESKTALGLFLIEITNNDIEHVKELVSSKIKKLHLYSDVTIEVKPTRDSQLASISLRYNTPEIHNFGIAFTQSTFLKMLDDWQQILENEPSKVDAYYDGKSVWFETR